MRACESSQVGGHTGREVGGHISDYKILRSRTLLGQNLTDKNAGNYERCRKETYNLIRVPLGNRKETYNLIRVPLGTEVQERNL